MNATMQRFAAIAFAALSWFSASHAQAQQPWNPAPGVYWSPLEHGIYYHVSVGPTGFMFVAVTTYRADGSPDFLVMQGQFQATTRDQWRTSGSLGTLSSPLYRMQNGQCLDCPYRNPQVVASEYGDASIEFFNDGRAQFRSARHSAALVRNPLATGSAELPRNRLAGEWAATYRPSGRTYNGIVSIGGAFPDRPGVGSAFAPFPPHARLAWACISGDCGGLDTPLPGNRAVGALDNGVLRILTINCDRIQCRDEPDGGVVVLDRENMMFGRQPSGTPTQGDEWILRQVRRADGMPRTSDGYAAWFPPNGLWWSPSQHGIYYHVNSNTSGFMFVGITTFESDGKPTHLVMQGQFEPTTYAQWRVNDEIGRLRSPLYRMRDGQCLGCAHREPSVAVSEFADAEVVFYTGNVAEFRHAGRSTPLELNRLVTADSAERASANKRLLGRWFVSTITQTGIQTALLDVLRPYTGPSGREGLVTRCTGCTGALARLDSSTTPDDGTLIASDSGRHQFGFYFIGFGQHFNQSYALHERDGVLYGRSRQNLPGIAQEVSMHRIGDVPP